MTGVEARGCMMLVSDSAESLLLRRLVGNDPAAWRELVQTYSGLLLGLSRRTFRSYGWQCSDPDCEDVVAEVWRNLLEDDRRLLRRCRERGQFLPMLQALTRHRTVDVLRRRKLWTVRYEEEEMSVAQPEPDPVPAEELAALPEALGTLSPKERRLVELFYLQEKAYREITLLTGVPLNSIGPTLARSLAKLRKRLSAHALGRAI